MHAAEIAEEAARNGAERILVTGGDGSVSEVVHGVALAQKAGFPSPKVVVIPSGRGNDFADAMDLPKAPDEIASMILADHCIDADICVAGDGTFERYFANGSGFGIDSAINSRAMEAPISGKASYLWGIGVSIFRDLIHQNAHFVIDGKAFDMKMVFVTAMNGRQEGGGFRLAPDFDVTDGLLDVCIFGNGLPAMKLISMLPNLKSGKLDVPGAYTCKAKSLEVHLDSDAKGLFSQVDGETIIENGRDFYASVSPYHFKLVTK